jgi:hypothetical protein
LAQLPEHLHLLVDGGVDYDDLELLDGITSCNVVDNYLMLDEYEQNLIKVINMQVFNGVRKL